MSIDSKLLTFQNPLKASDFKLSKPSLKSILLESFTSFLKVYWLPFSLSLCFLIFFSYLAIGKSIELSTNQAMLTSIQQNYSQLTVDNSYLQSNHTKASGDLSAQQNLQNELKALVSSYKDDIAAISQRSIDLAQKKLLLFNEVTAKKQYIDDFVKSLEPLSLISVLEKHIEEVKAKILVLNQQSMKSELTGIVDSKILKSKEELELIGQWLQAKPSFGLKLLYRMSDHGNLPTAFHSLCDDKRNTLVVVALSNGMTVGGFTSRTWDGYGVKHDSKAFLFNLSEKKRYEVSDKIKAIYTRDYTFPQFGDEDLVIEQNNKIITRFPATNVVNLQFKFAPYEIPYNLYDNFEVFQVDNYCR